MDFTSLGLLFLFLFLPFFSLFYIVARPNTRLILILVASVLFLAWGHLGALILLSGMLVAGYLLGWAIDHLKAEGRSSAQWLLIGSVGLNVALFVILKAPSASWFTQLVRQINWPDFLALSSTGLVVPLGISYVTLQLIGYLVDIGQGRIHAESNFLHLAVYVLFFPKVVSGPLIRYQPFANQIGGLTPSALEIAAGLRRILIGFVKRALVANQLAIVTNAAFDLPKPNLEPWLAWLVLIAYTLQIYFDFAGYTDMALGLGQLMGVQLPENFNAPYISQSVSEFWRRWHISLSTWFREYVFYPLERHRFAWAGQQLNIIIVFILTGLWHGLTPKYVVWGLLHGTAIALESMGFGRWLKTLWRPFRHFYTLLIILAGWVIFRSNGLANAFIYFSRLAGNRVGLVPLVFSQSAPLPFVQPSFILILCIAGIFVLPVASLWQKLRANWETGKPALAVTFQVIEDFGMICLFLFGLAATVSNQLPPNIYAKF